MTDPIKAKIIELCPDVMEKYNRCMGCGYGFDFCKKGKTCPITQRELPITLAVVLRAIAKKSPTGMDFQVLTAKDGVFFVMQNATDTEAWNLEQDNYDQQSEECKLFIGNLLGV